VAGCTDATKDPHGYDTAAELAEMRAAKRTLVYLVTGVRDITLACASSLAERAYAGGSARLLGDSGLSAAFADLVRSGYAPVTVTPDVVTTARSATDGFTVQVSNPNGFPLDTAAVILRLPKGLSFVAGSSSGTLGRPRVEGGTIEWRLGRALAASETLTGHVVVEADRAGRRTVVGETAVTLPSGFSFVSKSSATIRVMNRLERVELRVGGAVSAGARLRGTATVRRPLVLDPAPRPAWGTLTVTLPRQRALRLDVDSVGFARFAAPVRATLAVDVRSAVGLPGCAPGTRGTVRLVDSARIGSAGPADRVTVTLPASCAAARGTWTGPIVAVTAR
jgi:hypothetical protein